MSQDPPVPPPPDPCMVGAGVPPVGTISNFENPETLVPVLFSVPVLLAIISVIFTLCRVFINRRKLWWSDYFAAIALVLSLAHISLLFTQARYARHRWDVRACWYNGTYIKTLFSLEILSTFVLFFSKASILLLFHQLFEIKRPTRIAILYGIIFTALLYIFVNITLSAIFTAPHAGETWAGILMYKDPRKQLIWGIVQSVLGTGLDLFIFLLPIPIILKLHLSTNGKIQLLAVFAIASVGVVASVLSLVYRVKALDTNDDTWAYMALIICNTVETKVAIIVSSTPGFARFVRVYIPRLEMFGSLSGSDINLTNDPSRPRTKGTSGVLAKSLGPLEDAYTLQ